MRSWLKQLVNAMLGQRHSTPETATTPPPAQTPTPTVFANTGVHSTQSLKALIDAISRGDKAYVFTFALNRHDAQQVIPVDWWAEFEIFRKEHQHVR
jgi:hypothetical protein